MMLPFLVLLALSHAQILENCFLFNEKTQRCVFCHNSYTLSDEGTCINSNDNNSNQISDNDESIAVEQQDCPLQDFITIDDAKCMSLIPGCKIHSANSGICVECFPGLDLINNKQCIDQNCQQKGKNPCQKCAFGYQLNQNNVCADPNCLARSSTICLKCKAGYQIRKKICTKKTQPCIQADIQGQCTDCMTMYDLMKGKCIPKIPNCHERNQQHQQRCNVCLAGYYKNKLFTCSKLPSMCILFDEIKFKCIKCKENAILQSGECIDPNCQQIGQDQCTKCSQGYIYNRTEHMCVSKNLQCQQGYYLSENSCHKLPKNCINATKKGSVQICRHCKQSYIMDSLGNCFFFDPVCEESDKNRCLKCLPGHYVEQNGLCFKRPNFCMLPKDFGLVCLKCELNYKLNELGECEADKMLRVDNCLEYTQQLQCSKCEQGYILKANFCAKVDKTDPQCDNYDQNSCVKCKDGYLLEKGICIVDQRYDQTKTDESCIDYDGLGNCLKCKIGYQLTKNGGCYLQDKSNYCSAFNQQRQCTRCMNRYYLTPQKQCKQVSILCGMYHTTTGECLSCISRSYDLQNGKCVQLAYLVPKCVRFVGPYCHECQPGYYLYKHSCYLKDNRCLEFNEEKALCKRCKKGFKPIGPKCELQSK